MYDCKTIHEAYWEAIRVECMLIGSHLGRVMSQERKSSRITADHVVEPVVNDIQTEKQEQDTKDSTTTCGLEFPLLGNGDQNIQVARESTSTVEISHIDIIFGDEQRIVRGCDLIVQVLHMKYPKARSHSQRKYGHQKKQCVKPTSNWRRISTTFFKAYTEVADKTMGRKFV